MGMAADAAGEPPLRHFCAPEYQNICSAHLTYEETYDMVQSEAN